MRRPDGRFRWSEGSLAVHLRGPPCPSVRSASTMGSRVLQLSRRLRFADRELRGPLHRKGHMGSFLLNTTTPLVFRSFSVLPSRSCPLARLALSGSLRSLTVSRGVVQRSPLHRDPCQSPLPATVCSALARSALRDVRSGVARRSRATRSPSDPAVSTTSPVCSSASCRSVAPGPDPEVRPVSRRFGSRLSVVPRSAFLPFEAFFLAGSHRHRSRAACGGPSPTRRCRRAVHRSPCLLVLGRFPFRNLEALLPRRSGAHAHGFPRRRALAPLGLSLPPLTSL